MDTTMDTMTRTPEQLAAQIAALTSDERDFLFLLDNRESGQWEARHMSADSERIANRLAHRGLCVRTIIRNERNHRAVLFERDAAAAEALDAWDMAQAARDAERVAADAAVRDAVWAEYTREQDALAARRYVVTLHYDAHPLLESRVVWEGQGFWVAARWAHDAAKSLLSGHPYSYVEHTADNATYSAYLQDHSKQGLVYVLEGHAVLEELPIIVPVLTPQEPITERPGTLTDAQPGAVAERQERQETNTLAVGDQVVRVSGAAHGWGSDGAGIIERLIPGHMDKYPVRWVDAKAVVAWPAPRRIGGSGAMRTTVALKALARPDEMGACDKCGRQRRLITTETARSCGTCLSREERRINTRELWGHGRRGY
jgi:hypothetical protein